MNPKLLFDSSVYIQALREKHHDILATRQLAKGVVYFSTVVGSELLRGVEEKKAIRLIEGLWRDFTRLGRLIVPGVGDWYDAGSLLAKIAQKYGYEIIGQTRLVHDTLIALSPRRLGISVVTLNLADFQRIAEFRSFSLLSPSSIGS